MKWSFLVWLFALVLLFTHSVTAQKLPFLVLNREEQQEAVHTTKQAVQWWLGRKYSNLYSLYSSAASFLNTEGFPESERKARFIKWCSAWRERNPYNSRLSEDEKIERLRTVDVSIKLLTGFVLMNMKSSYWDALTKGKWHRDTKIAFVEFHIRGRRYIQPLIREDKRWKILTIPLTFDEQMIREYEGLRGDGTDRPHLIKGGASERLVPATTCVTCSGYCATIRAVRRRRGGGRHAISFNFSPNTKRCAQWQKSEAQRQIVTRMGREQNLSPLSASVAPTASRYAVQGTPSARCACPQ
jgi:hypothetical protein